MTILEKRKSSRRTVVKGLGATLGATVAAPNLLTRASAQSNTLVVYNFDGVLGKFIKEAWIDPFTQKHGVRIETSHDARLFAADGEDQGPGRGRPPGR